VSNLGMAEGTLRAFDALVHQPHGIILVTGPTGSGKSTTLYAAIRRLDHTTTNIMTVEDPIEYDIEGIGQTQVNAKIDMTFSRALRAILRQDPDVVMIGEIRDLETAQIAAAAITRLIDMGIEPFLLASSLIGVLAQRLVRKLCANCRQPDPISRGWRAIGCPQCSSTGYRGRTGIYELLTINDGIRSIIHGGASDEAIRQAGQANGMEPMRADGARWIADGTTSEDEVLRVTRD
jgi:general secretion pathway protein E